MDDVQFTGSESPNREVEIRELEERLKTLKTETHTSHSKNQYTIPVAIIVAGLMIGGAIIYSNQFSSNSPNGFAKVSGTGDAVGQEGQRPATGQAPGIENLREISSSDHILGSPDAPIKIVEYSDTECPFCKRYHETLTQVMDTYGADGRVAWVYRHFPLTQLHRKARDEALATECAASLGGNDGFWRYLDRLFIITPSNDGLAASQLPQIAKDVGIDQAQFEKCLETADQNFGNRVDEDFTNAIAAGGQGTPFSVLLGPNNVRQVISGAQPYEVVSQYIEQALNQ